MSAPVDPMFGRRRRSRLRSYLVEGFAVVFVLVASNVAGTLITLGLAGKIARQCARELQRSLQ